MSILCLLLKVPSNNNSTKKNHFIFSQRAMHYFQYMIKSICALLYIAITLIYCPFPNCASEFINESSSNLLQHDNAQNGVRKRVAKKSCVLYRAVTSTPLNIFEMNSYTGCTLGLLTRNQFPNH